MTARQKNDRKKTREIMIVAAGCILYAFFLMLQSPNSPFSKVPEYIDSGVFQYIGKGILDGRMPYRDAFDHKGPLLYLINAFGFLIGGREGIWFLEWMIMAAAMLAAYKMCRAFFSGFGSGAAVVLTFSLMGIYLKGGNFTEEYALLPCITALLVFAGYFKEGRVSGGRLILLGACFMSVLLLKANIAGVWVVFCAYIFVASLLKKEWKNLGRYIGFFLIGCLCVFLPVALWLVCEGVWSDFINAYLRFNMMYVEAKGSMAMLDAAKFFLDENLQLMLLLGAAAPVFVYMKDKDRDKLRFVSLNSVYLFFAFVLMIMPGNHYIHYGLYYMAGMLVPFAVFFGFLETMFKMEDRVAVCVALCLILFLVRKIWISNMLSQIDEIGLTARVSEEKEQLVDTVQSLTEPDERILVIGNECWIYNHTGRQAVNPYIFQHPLVWISEEIERDYTSLIEKNPPDLVVSQGDGSMDDSICARYGCRLVKVCGVYRVYEKLS